MMVFNHSMEQGARLHPRQHPGHDGASARGGAGVRARPQEFGQSIGKFQSVANRLVDMKVRLESARLLVHKLGWEWDRGGGKPIDASMVKLVLPEAWVQSSIDAMAVHGAYGYMTESEIEREVRDAMASRIYSGTSDIQRNIIASQMKL